MAGKTQNNIPAKADRVTITTTRVIGAYNRSMAPNTAGWRLHFTYTQYLTFFIALHSGGQIGNSTPWLVDAAASNSTI